jgi:hypothetical protein
VNDLTPEARVQRMARLLAQAAIRAAAAEGDDEQRGQDRAEVKDTSRTDNSPAGNPMNATEKAPANRSTDR